MAGTRETIKVALKEPVAQPWTDDEGEHLKWNVTTLDGHARFTIFDTKIHAAIIERSLVGVEREYVVQPAREPKKFPPTIIGIPGIVEAKGKGGGGGGSRPMFTDRQVAFLVLTAQERQSLAEAELAELVDVYARIMAGTPNAAPAKPQPRQNGSGARPPAATAPPKKAVPPAPAAAEEDAEEHRLLEEQRKAVKDLLAASHGGDVDAIKARLRSRFGDGYAGLHTLTMDELRALHEELVPF